MVPMLSLFGPYVVSTCSVSASVLSGPYLVTTWSSPDPSLGPTWTLHGLTGNIMVPTLSLFGTYAVPT